MSIPTIIVRQFRPAGAILLCLAFVRSPAQVIHSSTGEPHIIQSWTVEAGLPQNSANAIIQSSDGYLWIGTYGGVVRFDGVRFERYQFSDATGKQRLRVVGLAEGPDTTVWVGTELGGVFTIKGGIVRRIYPEGLKSPSAVLTMNRTREGLVWIGRQGVGLLRGARTVGGADTVLSSTLQPDFDKPDIASISVTSSAMWVGGFRGMAILAGTGIETVALPSLAEEVRVDAIETDSAGTVWVGTSDASVYRFDSDRNPNLTPVRLAGSYAFDEVLDPGRPELRIAVRVARLLFSGGRFMRSDTAPPGAWHVKSILRDKEGNVWIGTTRNGLSRIRAAAFEMISTRSEASVTSMAEDREGNVYIGQNCGTVEVFKGNRIISHPVTDILGTACVWSLFIDRQQRLWVGTWGGGVIRLDPSAPKSSTTSFGASSFIKSNIVLAISQAPDGTMWFGTYDAGVVRSRGNRTERWSVAEGLPGNDVRAIAFDSAGATWVGTTGGLAKIDNGIVRAFTQADGIGTFAIRVLRAEGDGSVWVGTYGGGLYRWKNGTFRRIGIDQGMFDDVVSQYMEGAHGYVWMGSNRGIWKVNKQELRAVADGLLASVNSIPYGSRDGLSVVETNGGFQPSGLRTRGEELLFPTISGVARVNTSRLTVNTTPPPVLIEKAEADGEEMVPNSLLEFPAGTKEIRITFAALSFSAPEKMKFRYRLFGYNTNWVDHAGGREVTYSNIPAGSYLFRVIASNNDGVWNEEGADLAIVVDTPFYETLWFRSLAILALVGMGMLVVSVRLRQVRRQKTLQEDTSRRLIESQEEERQRIAGELHDSLGQELIVAKNRLMLAAHHLPEEGPAREELTQVADALANALKSVRSIAYNLRPFQLDRLGLTETIRSTVRTIQQATTVVIESEIENIDGLLDKDSEIGLFRIIQEALTNVVKHSEAARASIVVSRDEDAVVIRVQDDGKGFQMPESSENPAAYGFGLSGIVERVRLLGGIYKIASAPGTGVSIAVRVPVSGIQESGL